VTSRKRGRGPARSAPGRASAPPSAAVGAMLGGGAAPQPPL